MAPYFPQPVKETRIMPTIKVSNAEIKNPEFMGALLALSRKPFPAACGWQLKDFSDKLSEIGKKVSSMEVEIALRNGAKKNPDGSAEFNEKHSIPEAFNKEHAELMELEHEIEFTPFKLPTTDISGKPIQYEPIIQILLSKLLIR